MARNAYLAAAVFAMLSAVASGGVFDMPPGQVSLETVHVGNPGNAADPTTGLGAVNYGYDIGKYEVTAGQYTQFLNAVAKSDPYGLYHEDMNGLETVPNPAIYGCGIEQIGVSGAYVYSCRPDWANRPVNHVDWYDAVRFVNWLHNGQPSGPLANLSTERGSYNLQLGEGAPGSGPNGTTLITNVGRSADATWVLATDDEWYKAAYHKNNGPTDDYYLFPTSSDTAPIHDLTDPDGGNNANWFNRDDGGYTLGTDSEYYRSVVGEFENTQSPYGAFDMAGNVWEWTDEWELTLMGLPGRVQRGAGFTDTSTEYMESDMYAVRLHTEEFNFSGFRVAQVPEPTTLSLLSLAGLAMLRRRKR